MKGYFGAKIVSKNTMKMVHDDDLTALLHSLKVYDEVMDGEYHCLFCGRTITLQNIDSIVPHNNSVQFTCGNQECHNNLLGINEGVAYGNNQQVIRG